MRTRFAPSPTGYLHIGHVRAAIEAFQYAERQNGTCLLRIEDTDHTRCKPDYVRGIYEDLDWLGFDWPLPVRQQSQHYSDFAKVVITLVQRGLAYPCTLTRSEIKGGKAPSPKHRAEQWENDNVITQLRRAAAAEKPALPFAIRLHMSKALASIDNSAVFTETGPSHFAVHKIAQILQHRADPIIARKDIGCSYLIAGPHDDWAQNITHVIRGEDLFEETAMHVLIQNLMGWPTPIYYHHTLVLADTGEKLSKRNLDTSLRSLRAAGQTRDDIYRLLNMSRV